MNLKALLMLCLILFASASTIVALTVSFGTQISEALDTATISQTLESGQVEPTGDPIDDPVPPDLK